jgi:DNA invertase Pin-like site-specific DNA recombinase
MTTKPVLRCGIYTRKSTEEGLEQDFNSLHAQREACEAFITSQRHEGWQLVKTAYDDGGFSGGNMQRPALQKLMDDIAAQKINVVVVYKVDRLTRSLADFAKIVECFDKQGVSFVSVTQQFNTTSSMGRLTLNVLLSFAQFEREVTGERIRDKIAASRKKGMWMGGSVPLGYDAVVKKLIINAQEAETVRHIYKRYLELGCVRLLQDYLIKQSIHSKVRESTARPGGGYYTRGALYCILSNPVYIGQVRHKGVCHPGQHKGIIDPALWEQVQQHRADNRIGLSTKSRKTEPCPLTGKLFDVSGERLVPVHALKKGRRYRYYVSQSLTEGTRDDSPHGWRLPGQEIEQTVRRLVQSMLNDRDAITSSLQASGIVSNLIPAALNAAREINIINTSVIFDKLIKRIELQQDGIRITLSLASLTANTEQAPTMTRDIPMQMKRRGTEMRLVIEGSNTPNTNSDPILIKTIARAYAWSEELFTGRMPSMEAIASHNNVSHSYVKKLMPLAFLAPDIIKDIIAGKQPTHLTTQKLIRQIDIPMDWKEQKREFNFKY